MTNSFQKWYLGYQSCGNSSGNEVEWGIDGCIHREYWYVHPLVAELRTGSNWCSACSTQLQRQSVQRRGSRRRPAGRDSLFDGGDLRASSSFSSLDRPASLWPVERNVARSNDGRGAVVTRHRFTPAWLSVLPAPPRPVEQRNRCRTEIDRPARSPAPTVTLLGRRALPRPAATRRPTSDHSTTTSKMIMIVDCFRADQRRRRSRSVHLALRHVHVCGPCDRNNGKVTDELRTIKPPFHKTPRDTTHRSITSCICVCSKHYSKVENRGTRSITVFHWTNRL